LPLVDRAIELKPRGAALAPDSRATGGFVRPLTSTRYQPFSMRYRSPSASSSFRAYGSRSGSTVQAAFILSTVTSKVMGRVGSKPQNGAVSMAATPSSPSFVNGPV
jgi:hypothetical protein